MAEKQRGWEGADLGGLYFGKTPLQVNRRYSLTSEMLALLEKIDASRSMAEISQVLGMPPPRLRRCLSRLMEAGLIAPAAPAANGRYLERKTFLEPLKSHLINAVGPMADIILSDVTARMGLDPAQIPVAWAAELVLNLSKEILDSEMKVEFQSAMIALLRNRRPAP